MSRVRCKPFLLKLINIFTLCSLLLATLAPMAQAPAQEMTREESERRQALWWYLLLAGMLLLAAETVIANRLSKTERFL